jgi:hypothetical protein
MYVYITRRYKGTRTQYTYLLHKHVHTHISSRCRSSCWHTATRDGGSWCACLRCEWCARIRRSSQVRFLCVCLCVYIYIYIYGYVSINSLCVRANTECVVFQHNCACIFFKCTRASNGCSHVRVYVSNCVCMHTCVHVHASNGCPHLRVYVCVCVYIYIYTRSLTWKSIYTSYSILTYTKYIGYHIHKNTWLQYSHTQNTRGSGGFQTSSLVAVKGICWLRGLCRKVSRIKPSGMLIYIYMQILFRCTSAYMCSLMCVCVCMYIRMHIHMHMHIHVRIHIHIRMHMHMPNHTYVNVSKYTYIWHDALCLSVAQENSTHLE